MYYVGIDVAKQTHYAAVMNSDGEILISPFSFSNNHNGFQLLLDRLSEFSKEEILIGMESTAHYAENLTCFIKFFIFCNVNKVVFPCNFIMFYICSYLLNPSSKNLSTSEYETRSVFACFTYVSSSAFSTPSLALAIIMSNSVLVRRDAVFFSILSFSQIQIRCVCFIKMNNI